MKVINLFGAPSCGKTSTMLVLAGFMNKMGINADVAPEVYKEFIYDNTHSYEDDVPVIAKRTSRNVAKFGGQLIILAEQNRRIARMSNSKDIIITDCPLPLISYYAPEGYSVNFNNMAIELFNKYDNYNIYLRRGHEFQKQTRVHDEQQAQRIDAELYEFLMNNNISIDLEIKTSQDIEKRLFSAIQRQMDILKPKN